MVEEATPKDFFWNSYGISLSERLRTLRMMRKMSQERLAEMAGLHRNVIVNLERNLSSRDGVPDPKLSTVYRLAAALRVPVAVLLPGAFIAPEPLCPRGEEIPSSVTFSWPTGLSDALPFDDTYVYAMRDPRHISISDPVKRLKNKGVPPEFIELVRSVYEDAKKAAQAARQQ